MKNNGKEMKRRVKFCRDNIKKKIEIRNIKVKYK